MGEAIDWQISLLSTVQGSNSKMDYIVGSRPLSLESMRYSSLHLTIFLVAVLVFLFLGLTISLGIANTKNFSDSALVSYAKFFYASFLKPHRRGDGGQQSALESFYEAQVCAPSVPPSGTFPKLFERPEYTMPHASDSSEEGKICLDYWQPNSYIEDPR